MAAKTQRLTPRVIMLSIPPSGPYARDSSNIYLVGSGKRKMLIDTGNGNREWKELLLQALNGGSIGRVLLTHSHGGHSNGVGDLEALAGMWGMGRSSVSSSSSSMNSMLGTVQTIAKRSAALGQAMVQDATTLAREVLDSHADAKETATKQTQSRIWISKIQSKGDRASPPARDRQGDPVGLTFLKDGERIVVKGDSDSDPITTIEVMSTPGHSADHASFYVHEEMAVFAGDSIASTACSPDNYKENAASFVVYEDLRTYMGMLEKWRSHRNVPRVIYPGHGNVIVDGVGAIEKALAAQKHLSNIILDTIKTGRGKPLSTLQILDILTPQYTKNTFHVAGDKTLAIRGTIRLHLLELERLGRIQRRHLGASEKTDSPGGNMKGPGALTMNQVFSAIKESQRRDWSGNESKQYVPKYRERGHAVHGGHEQIGGEIEWVYT
ncbi:Beta-lactamase-like protein 2 [Phlyctochytrium planicorne]|nr:Beta-lactamase-like protein 2 [Phlyctochytrium planicorne]